MTTTDTTTTDTTSTDTTTTERPARNGVDVPVLFATLGAVSEQPTLAEFEFRARNTWINGTHNRTSIQGFYGAGQEDTSRTEPFTLDADHPPVLVGAGKAPTAAESLLHAIAACLTHGIANIAAARGITLHRVESSVEGDINLMGLLGLDTSVRNGFTQLRVRFEIEGDGTPEELTALVHRSRDRSAVYDVLTNGTDVQVDVVVPA